MFASAATASTASWPPAGYSAWNSNVAYRWVQHPRCTTDSAWCWQIDVRTRRGCPNGVYVSMNLVKARRVVSYTNDSLDSLLPREVGRLTLETYRNVNAGRLTKITCY